MGSCRLVVVLSHIPTVHAPYRPYLRPNGPPHIQRIIATHPLTVLSTTLPRLPELAD
jgi:hypothetical protein